MNLLLISLAPVAIIAFYIYFRDKYEKEPVKILLLALALGGIITIPVIFVETFLDKFTFHFASSQIFKAAYEGFVVAAFTEELFKYLAFVLIIWRNRNFNEKFDGIVYAVFISLGFAAVENVLYVFGSGDAGHQVGLLRAVTAVPAHALFGIAMGYHLGLAKFFPHERVGQFFKALLVPIFLHGAYDFLILSENGILLLIFIPYIVLLWIFGFRRMKRHSDNSVFRTDADL